MHSVEVSYATLSSSRIQSFWNLSTNDLENLATVSICALQGGWVRTGENFVRVGGVKYGADARQIDLELIALANEANRIKKAANPETVLRAAAFYFLRFQNIHPLCEANGRIGRVILAGQLEQALNIPMNETLRSLKDWEMDYRRLFSTNNPPVMFELMLDLLSRITGIVVSPSASKLPASLEPLRPQKNVPKNVPRLHPEKALANPDLVKEFAAKHVRPPSRNFFKKFF